MQIDFFVAGVQKGATTALHGILSQHPELSLSSPKELHLFDDESRDWGAALPDLSPHFPAPGRLRGEATPIYTFWPRAIERIAAHNPGARLIMLLRHPTLRAHSQWRMQFRKGVETRAFVEAIAPVPLISESQLRQHSYVARGFYAGQVRRLLAHFPRENLLFLRTDALWLRPAPTLGQICDFLGVAAPTAAMLERATVYTVPVLARDLGEMPEPLRRDLDRRFAADIIETAALTGLGLSDWLDPAYAEPMRPQETAGGQV
ncbi:deacetylase sulfotransferase [Gemmobacter lanyuensis]|uniref:Deacetylase sulfotransferase n=1 Tax=Gemmobacter lanyuensis TaxID=1054497 RepID=A0A918IS09_9RHOB|nr:sulfotransferase [Gemmobacter lanyuensis]GGW28430.1 deacetylase sulfotransferase [Gemmobacter lanyuensis]